jgi:hypothetical protein
MVRGFVGSLGALAVVTVLAVTSVGAETVLRGTVKQVYPRSGVIVFDDGRQVQTTGATVVLREQRPVGGLAALRPGDAVVVVQQDGTSASPAFTPEGPTMSPYGPTNEPQAP